MDKHDVNYRIGNTEEASVSGVVEVYTRVNQDMEEEEPLLGGSRKGSRQEYE